MSDHIRLFNSIAKPYNWFFKTQLNHYRQVLVRHWDYLGLSPGAEVLDIGCGSGAFAAAFKERNLAVAGVDGAERMAAIARKRGLECTVADVTGKLPFPDRSYDLVTAAWVAHGLHGNDRVHLYSEIARLTKKCALISDYSPANRGFSLLSINGLLERLEKSDYLEFRRYGCDELEGIFQRVTVLPVDKRSCWYLCERKG